MSNPHINIASDLDFYKNGLPLPLKLAAANCVREMHKLAQELLGDSVGEIYAQDDNGVAT